MSGPDLLRFGVVAAFLQFGAAMHESLPAQSPRLPLQLLPQRLPPDPAGTLIPDLAPSGPVARDRTLAT
jgi:hypothetical protein